MKPDSTLPVIALILAASPFDGNVAVERMPAWLRDSLLTTSVLAAAAWWFGYFRHRLIPMMHVGSASAALAVYRAIAIFRAESVDLHRIGEAVFATRELVTVVLFAMAGYVLVSSLLRRSRWEALAALVPNFAAVVVSVWQQVPSDTFIVCLAAGWSWLIGTRIVTLRPNLLSQVMPVMFLIIATCVYDFGSELTWYARGHGLILILALLLVSHIWPWTCRRVLGLASGGAYLGFMFWRGARSQGSPLAATVLAGGFLLLMLGAFISWHKDRFLGLMQTSKGKDRG